MNQRGPSQTGKKIKNLRVLDSLGSGGMGVVYAAFDETLERKVALKVLHRERRLDPDARARFRREARLLSQIRHPNVCQLHEFFEEDGVQYLVMELAEGEPLSRAHQQLPFQERLHLAEQIALVLEVGHRRGILHRDLKPDNIMIDGWRVKVLDFGLARLLEDEIPTVDLVRGSEPAENQSPEEGKGDRPLLNTGLGRVLGTPSYMSPEQASGDPVSPASDLFALGMLLHFLFSKEPAYSSGLSQDEVIERAAQAKVRPPVGVRSDVQRLIERLQQRNPDARPTASEALRAIRAIESRNRRWLRRAGAAAVALVLLGGSAKYLTDLRRERSAATAASERAQVARKEAEATSDFLVAMLKGVQPLKTSPRDQRVGDLVEQARQNLDQSRDLEPTDRARLYHSLGMVYHALTDREAAAEMFQKAESLRREHLGEADPRRAISLALVAAMNRSRSGASDESMAQAQEALSVLAPHKDNYPNDWVSVVSGVVAQLLDRKQWDTARALLEQELSWAEGALGRDDRRWLKLELQRLNVLADMGEGPRALEARTALEPLILVVFGRDSIEHLTNEQVVSHLLRQAGRPQEAIALLRAQLERLEPIADPNHEMVTIALQLLATALLDVGDVEASVEAARRSYEGTLARAGPNSVEPAPAAVGLADSLTHLGQYEAAEELLLRWQPVLIDHFGDGSYFVLELRYYLKQALLGQGRVEEAGAIGNVH